MKKRRANQQTRRGFTAVELLIVIAAMAILAGVVVPQVGASIEQAKESAMLANLHMITTAIERFKIDHEGLPPEISSGQALSQLTVQTDLYGNEGSGAEFVYGPYVLDGLPPNPLNGDANVYETQVAPPADQANKTGWLYFPSTGQIWAGERRAGK